MGGHRAVAKRSWLSSSGLSFVPIGFMWGLSRGTPGARTVGCRFHRLLDP